LTKGRDAGVRRDDVQAAQFGDAIGDDLLQSGVVANVSLTGQDATAGLFDQLDGGGQIVWSAWRITDAVDRSADVDGDDVCALFSQTDSVSLSLASRCAGHQRDLALDPTCHVRDSFVSTKLINGVVVQYLTGLLARRPA
jgi:hypothetical protein